MANRKISDLTALTTPASGDYLPIVDISEAAAADKNKRITVEELMRGVPSGTAGAPGLAFEADPNTGIYSPGTDQLALSTNGTGRLFVDASGNIGAGYSNPGNFAGGDLGAIRPLVVGDGTASTNVNIFSNSTGYGHVAFSDGTSGASTYAGLIQYYHVTNSMTLYTASTERLRINSAGLVGIGTSSPGSLLDLVGGDIRLNSVYGINKSNADGYIHLSGGTSNVLGGSIFCFGQSHVSNANEIHFRNSGNQTRAVIDSSGRLGIGTNSPQVNLHLKDLTNPRLRFEQNNSSSQQQIESSGGNFVFTADVTNAIGGVNIVFKSGTNERARITSDGKLLVGTSSDSGGALLQVNGNRIRVATAKTPASASDTGTTGEICWDASYIYVCTATNTWKRAALSTW